LLNLALETHPKTRFRRNTKGEDKSDGKRKRRSKQLLNDLEKINGYLELKEEVPDRKICGEFALEGANDLS